jgi:hypothetical protein
MSICTRKAARARREVLVMAKWKRATKRRAPEAVRTAPPPLLVRHAYWLAPFALFLVLRLFSGEPYFGLSGDQCTFLELGRTFPKHQLYNHELYLIHPPLFGFAVGLLNLLLPLLASGLAASLLFACIAFFAVRNLAESEDISRPAIFAGLLYIAINRSAVAYDYQVARVSILVCSTGLAFLAFLRLLRKPSRETLLTAIAANVFCLLVSDQAVLLLPCEAAILWARGSRREAKPVLLVAACSAVAALAWPLVRFFEFSTHRDLPAGIDGTIEFTRNISPMAVIQPNFLPFTNIHRSLFTQTSLSIWNLKPALLASLPPGLLLVPPAVSRGIVILLILAAFARPGRRQRAIQWLAMSVLFLLPVGMGMYPWYSMGFMVPFTLLIMEGASSVFAWAGAYLSSLERNLTIGLSAASVLAAVLWLTAPSPADHNILFPRGGIHFLFTRPPVTRAAEVSRFFAAAPRDTGIMAPVDLTPEIVYLTDKRVVALPFDPGLLDQFIGEYHISYLLTSSEFLRGYKSTVADKYTGAQVTRSLFEHPERYRPVGFRREEYPAFNRPTEYYVFQVAAN